MGEGFLFASADDAMKFFDACEKAKAVTLEERLAVMRHLVATKEAKYIRDTEEFIKDKNILKIDPEELK